MAEKAATTEKSDHDISDPISLPEDSSPRKKDYSRPRRRRSPYVYYSDSELSEEELPPIEDSSLLERPLTSGVRYYNYNGFQNRMRKDEGDFGIEVFVAKPDWFSEMMAEDDMRDCPPPKRPQRPRHRSSRRQPLPEQAHLPRMPPPQRPPPPVIKESRQQFASSNGPPPPPPPPPYFPPVPHPDFYDVEVRAPDQRLDGHKYAYASRLQLSSGSETAPDGRIMRIRLRSEVVLRALASVAGYDGIAREKVVEFHRPFRVLEESLTGMKSKLSEMERAMEKQTPGASHVAEKSEQQEVDHTDNAPLSSESLGTADPINTLPDLSEGKGNEEHTTSPAAVDRDLEHMRCFVNFVEQVVLPIRERFRGSELQKRRRVCFEDIPYLFQPGSLAFLTHRARTKRLLHRSAVQKVWRMVSCCPATVPTVYRYGSTMNPSQFTRWSLYSFDYDGENLVPIWAVVKFERFTGEMDITSLECYPLSLHENVKDIIEEQKACGKLFLKCIRSSAKHHYYSGWTFITGLSAEPLLDDGGRELHFPEHIESEIVVDFKETLQSYPGWETYSGSPQPWVGSSWDSEPYAEYPLKIWDEDARTFPQPRLSYPVNTSIVIEEQELYESEAKAWFDRDSFLSKKTNWKEWSWSDEDIALLPRRVFAYILRERKFTRIDVRSIEFNTNQGNLTLDQIQMKPERRRMIRSAVAAHFRGKQGPSTSDLDPIRGKGKGLVILLHGAPGVGKTATAEAVAAETERPLFPITCGDLGFSPAAVERSLKDIFRYAHLWNCILLFDEADVFLTQRERGGGNLERNALVGGESTRNPTAPE